MLSSLYEEEDSRFYIKIKINDSEVEGLLDSGATVTYLGERCMNFVQKSGLPVLKFMSYIKTADGSPHKIVGREKATISFNKISSEVIFFLVPTLGVDFMRQFGLFATVCSITTNGVSLGPESEESEGKEETHILEPLQQARLHRVISGFPCFSKRSLGRTHLEVHIIDTRDA